ncbi:SPOSA6832_04292 [Sporobolomyces salmonicolor]|uniref:SPOSA6832_04292-mRNA-1:cds n=1 Tax=Sporidiobolus salmonicolor TaxID=5005 RepID=A0A0D6EQV2_SPOSA|nr:SPOSA6832_04292 [Sporobolomyces salmonicolor]
MSFSDLTRSYTTFSSISQPSATYYSAPAITTTAFQGASGIPGYSIAAADASTLSSAASAGGSSGGRVGRGGVDTGLALGLGLGLGIAVLLAAIAGLFVVRERRAARADFEKRARAIRSTMDSISAEGGAGPAPTMQQTR